MSPRDIHAIIKEEEARRQKYKDQKQQEDLLPKPYKLFIEGKHPLEVAVALNLRVRGNQILQRVLEAKTTTQPEYCLLRD